MRIELLADEEEGTEVRMAHWISICEARTLRERTRTATAVGAAQLLSSYQHHRGHHRRKTTSPPAQQQGETLWSGSVHFASQPCLLRMRRILQRSRESSCNVSVVHPFFPSTRSDASRDPRRVGLRLGTSDSRLWREPHDEDESAAVHQLE